MTGTPRINERGNLEVCIFGLPAHRLETEQRNYRLVSGSLDIGKFGSGDYVIFNRHSYDYYRDLYGITEHASGEEQIQAGDVLNLSFYDAAADTCRQKDLTVLAVIEGAHEYSSSDVDAAQLILPDTVFNELYPDYRNLTIIGISNLVNTLAADIFARRLEYAVMQAVGMTRNQLWIKLFGEAMRICGIALAVMLPAGWAVAAICPA